MTAGELAKALGVAYGTAKRILDSTGTGQVVSNSITIYRRTAAIAAVALQNQKVLEFLEFDLSRFEEQDT